MNIRAAVLLLLMQCGTALGAIGQVDQQYVPPTAFLWSDIVADSPAVSWGDKWSQTFTVGVTGRLAGLDISIERTPDITQPLHFDVRTTQEGAPTDPDTGPNILVSGAIAAESVSFHSYSDDPRTNILHIDTSGSLITVTAGDVLAVTLIGAAENPPIYDHYWWRGNEIGDYANGSAFVWAYGKSVNTGWQRWAADLVFRTYVTAVPEPSIVGLIASVSVFFAAGRRRPTSHNRS